METELFGLDNRIRRNIQFTARNLAHRRAVPGMDAEDFEQDLALDLFYRSRSFDPTRSSFRTFADRVVRHRVATLTAVTRRLVAERSFISLDATIVQEPGCECRPPLYVDETGLTEESIALRIDMHRLVESLSPVLVEGCQILLADTVSEGARDAGIHRSTAYERIRQLRDRATASGLAIYALADSLDEPPVSGGNHQRPQQQAYRMVFERSSERGRFVTESRLRDWIEDADVGGIFEYYRGALWLESSAQGSRLPERERIELVRVAEAARRAADQGLILLLQRRHGDCDYSYLATKPGPGPKGSWPCLARPGGRRS